MKKLIYQIGKLDEKEQFKLDIEDSLSRTVEERIKFGFIKLKLPIIDDKPYRIFNTMDEYRNWAEKELPKWLGYYREND